MNARGFLTEQGHRLVFLVDATHPQDMRALLDGWVRPIRGASVAVTGTSVPAGKVAVCLPTASWERPRTFKGLAVFVRPIYQDLLSFGDSAAIEDRVDVVLEARDGEATFYEVVAGHLRRTLLREAESAKRQAQRQQRQFEKRLRTAIAEIAEDPASHTLYLEAMERFLELLGDLSGAPGPETLTQNLELLARKLDRKKNWRLHFSRTEFGDEGQIFYLGTLNGASVFLEALVAPATALEVASAALIASCLTKVVRRWEADLSDVKPGHVVQEAFQALPFPVLLLGQRGEVLQHNTAFVKMNLPPSRVQRLDDIAQVQSKDQTWTVRKTGLAGGADARTLFTFLPEKVQGGAGESSLGGQDLGIITSSIAHELNNPVAGLLAALELLALEDFWDEEAREQIREMRQGTLRCKQLVETFLGFSRLTPTEGERRDKDLLKSCFEQALNLQRFRMVESGLRVTLTHFQQHPFAYALHAPTATMLAYLVIGDVMTAFHHLKLLERRSARGLALDLAVTEDADRFRVTITPTVTLKEGLSSKLLHYLLQQEKLQLDLLPGGELHFSHQNILI